MICIAITSKTFIVMRWRKRRGFKESGKLGEAICDDVLDDFLNKDKKHFKCSRSSVYYNAVKYIYTEQKTAL